MTTVKTQATTKQVLNSCDDLTSTLTQDDMVVLAIGANDKNPYLLFSELGTALHKLRNHKVFIVNVLYNSSLNVNLLNYNINLLTRNYNNCKYIKMEYNENYLKRLGFKLNIEIDHHHYKNKYLSPRRIRAILAYNGRSDTKVKHNCKCKTLKQRTILHYFHITQPQQNDTNITTTNTQSDVHVDKGELFRSHE
jgi:hypothetical protein